MKIMPHSKKKIFSVRRDQRDRSDFEAVGAIISSSTGLKLNIEVSSELKITAEQEEKIHLLLMGPVTKPFLPITRLDVYAAIEKQPRKKGKKVKVHYRFRKTLRHDNVEIILDPIDSKKK